MMRMYNFDEMIERRQTNSYKWDMAETLGGREDAIPLWIADMDFYAPPAVREALQERAAHGVFGYAAIPASCYEAVVEWVKHRHGWAIEPEWIVFTPGVVPAFHWVVKAYTHPGDQVIVQPPVYYPFFNAVRHNGCHIVENPLQADAAGHYTIDFEHLERQFTSRTKVLLLCSPHNPVGRVWTAAELTRLAELCLKHRVILCSDEIHHDLVFTGHRHVPTALLADDIAQATVTCMAANKTFNLAGLAVGLMIIPNRRLRQEFLHAKQNTGIETLNLFGLLATEIAYREGEAWLTELLAYLQGNRDFMADFVAARLAPLTMARPEGTYLAWLNCRGLQLDDAALHDFMLHQARLWLNDGAIFGGGGVGFQRLNFACPRARLEEALLRLERALAERGVRT